MQTLPAEPSSARGLSPRLPRPAWRARCVGAFPAASCCSGIKERESGFPFSLPRLLQPGPGAISLGLVQGASSAPPAGKWECASWIAAAATAVAGDEEALATPAGELGRRAEARGSESRAPASLLLGRAALRGPGATARPRAHTRPGDARARAGCGWTRAPAASLLLAAAPLPLPRSPGLHVSSPAPRAATAAASSASARRAPRTEPHTAYRLTPCMPPGPPAASRVAGQSRCRACCRARARASAPEPQCTPLETGLERPMPSGRLEN